MNDQQKPTTYKKTALTIAVSPIWLPPLLLQLAQFDICPPNAFPLAAIMILPVIVLAALFHVFGVLSGIGVALILFIPSFLSTFLFGWMLLETCRL